MVKLPYLHSIANVSLVSFFHIIAQGIKCNKKTHVCMYLFRVANVVKLPYSHSIANVSLVSFFHIKLPRGSNIPKKSCLHVFVRGSKCGQTTIFAQYSKGEYSYHIFSG